MKSKIILCLALGLSGGLFGCSTAPHHFAIKDTPDVSKLKITGFPYQTKPRWLDSDGLFYWFFSPDKKMVYYEPCSGNYDVDLLKESKTELIFKITDGSGVLLDLATGRRVAKADVVGKQYTAEIDGDQIVAVSEIKSFAPPRDNIGFDKHLTKQISAILTECQKIKPGMTRAELLKIFTTQGGIFTAVHRSFVYRGCPYIKVDVDFTVSDPKQKGIEERPIDIINKVSKPYLEWSLID
jgi:hypothetical protein